MRSRSDGVVTVSTSLSLSNRGPEYRDSTSSQLRLSLSSERPVTGPAVRLRKLHEAAALFRSREAVTSPRLRRGRGRGDVSEGCIRLWRRRQS
eukprot:16082-Rhodomonas_salina.3